MKKFQFLSILCVLCIAIITMGTGCENSTPTNTPEPEKPTGGYFDNNIYINEYFRMSMELPATWIVYGHEVNEISMMQDGKYVLGSFNDIIPVYFMANPNPDETNTEKTCILFVLAERLDNLSFKSVDSAIVGLKKTYTDSEHVVKFGDISSEIFGALEFKKLRVDLKMTNGLELSQIIYVAFYKEHCIEFTLSFDSESHEELMQVMSTLKFQ